MNTKEILQGIKNWTASKLGGKVDKTTTVNGHALSGDVSVSKSDIGLGNVTNDAQVKRSEMGAASGVATLDTAGKVPSSQLPSYVDDVLEFNSKSDFPSSGETGKIYVDKTTNKTWRWGGTDYVEISQSLALGETSSTAYAGDKGKALADKLATIETGAEVNVQSDWNATEGAAFIKNKPTIPVVPTNVSAFTNDAGYLTEHQSLANYYDKDETGELLDDKQDTLVSGTNIKTINSQSLLGSGNIVIEGGGNDTDVNYDTTNKKITKTIDDVTSDVVTAATIVEDGGGIEVEIGETAPTGTPKLFVDEDADPAVSIDVYTRAQVDAKVADTVHLSTQVLTTAEKDQVAQNLNNRPSTNGMARIELKATDDFKSVVEAQTGGNTVFVIKYDFTLTGDVTVPTNCILEFDGGSISGAHTITGANTGINAGLVKIFNTDVILAGTWNVAEAYPEWFGAKGDGTTDDTLALQKTMTLGAGIEIRLNKDSVYAISDTIVVNPYSTLNGNNATLKAVDDYDIILQANNVDGLIIDGNGYQNQYGIFVSNTLKDSYIRNCNIKNIKNDNKNVAGVIVNNTEENNHHVTVENNLIENLWSKDNGVLSDLQGSAAGISTYTESSLYILNNVIHGIKVSDDGYGIYVGERNNVYSVIVAGNHIYDVYNTGIKWHMPGTVVTNNKIDMDPVDANSQKMGYGIRAYGSYSEISNNNITYTGTGSMYGIFVESNESTGLGLHCVLDNNKIECPHGNLAISGVIKCVIRNHSIASDDESTTVPLVGIQDNNIVECNTITSVKLPLSIGSNNKIANNYIYGEAIALSYAYGSVLIDNYIDGKIEEKYKSDKVIVANNHVGAVYFSKSQVGLVVKGNVFHAITLVGAIIVVGNSAIIAENVIVHDTMGININGTGNNILSNKVESPNPITVSGQDSIVTLNIIPNGTSVSVSQYATDIYNQNNINLSV